MSLPPSVPKKGPKSLRGPKPPTVPFGTVSGASRAPTEHLNREEAKEFRRLVEECRKRGVLDKVDPQMIVDAACMQVLLRRERRAAEPNAATICKIQNALRGLRRDLALVQQPSRVVTRVHPNAHETLRSKWGDKMAGGDA